MKPYISFGTSSNGTAAPARRAKPEQITESAGLEAS
jgi:hypothetical protein